jgi:hypothetical protein
MIEGGRQCTFLITPSNSPCKLKPNPCYVTTDGQSVCLSWCRAPSGTHDNILILPEAEIRLNNI